MPEFSTPTKRSRRLRLTLVALIILALGGTTWLSLRPAKTKMAWLRPEELALRSAPTTNSRFKELLADLSSLLKLRHHRERIELEFSMLELSPTAAQDVGLRRPYAVNSDGLCAWIVRSRDLPEFWARLRTVPGGTNACSTTAFSDDGAQTTVSLNNFVPHPRGIKAFAGLDINLRYSAVRNSTKMIMGITAIDLSSNNPPVVQTNLFLACEALVPNENGLVLASKDGRWLIVYPKLIDSNTD